MPETVFKIAQTAIVGRDSDDTFREMMQTLQESQMIQVVAKFATLTSALEADLGGSISADFVIVLQSYSDEFSQDEINDLIGRMLFGRIVCCYGPWCMADGRSHELWPVAFRVPVASAPALLELELSGFLAGEQPVSPMSAGEEVFAHRSRFPPPVPPRHRNAIVLSNDVALRGTVAEILKSLQCQATVLPLSTSEIQACVVHNDVQRGLAIIDLDEPQGEVFECLSMLRTQLPTSLIVGLSVFAAALKAPAGNTALDEDTRRPQHVIEKTELLPQLRQLLNSDSIEGHHRNA